MCFFFFNDTATTEIYTLSLHDALPISGGVAPPAPPGCPPDCRGTRRGPVLPGGGGQRSEEHTSELQSQSNLVCRLLLEKKKTYECYHRFGRIAKAAWRSERPLYSRRTV